nr:hypothetical protein B0A51_15894 [Rachicladosporium sp. CCFEE 5018]
MSALPDAREDTMELPLTDRSLRQDEAGKKRKTRSSVHPIGEAVKRSKMRLRSRTGTENHDGELGVETEGMADGLMSGGSPVCGKGKGKQKVEVEVKPFRLMDLPTEMRLEIYRACLTRPYPIMLSKELTPVPKATAYEAVDENQQPLTSVSDPASLTAMMAVPTTSTAAQPRPWRRAVRSLHRGPVATTGHPNSTNPMTVYAGVHRSSPQSTPATATASGSAEDLLSPVRAARSQDADPLLVTILRTNKLVYKEARNILYGDNVFTLDLNTAQYTLSALHQRSRGQIKRIHVTIPTHNDILERFAEVVRLSFRYCWRLRQLCINMPFVIPGADGNGTNGNTTVYANAFDILRWLPKQCEIVLEGNVCEEVRSVVDKNANLAKDLDEVAYARRQLISNDNDRALRDAHRAFRC